MVKEIIGMKNMRKLCTSYDVFGGIISGLLIIVIATAFTALVFKGSLSAYFSIGITCALIGSLITNSLTSSFSSFSTSIARIETSAAVILAVIFANIANAMPSSNLSVLPTLLVTLSISSLLVGGILFLLGYFRLGHIIRFLPYPVMGGLISGTAWMMGYSSFVMMVNNNFTLDNILQHTILMQTLLGVGFGMFLFIISQKYQQAWILPASILILSIFINIILLINHISHADAINQGWFFSSFKPSFVLESINPSMLKQVEWNLIFNQLGYILSLAGIIIIILLFTVSSLETTFKTKADLDHELKIAGVGNLLGGMLIAAPNNLSLTGTLVNTNMGATHRISGIIASLVCIIVLFIYPDTVSYLPKPVIGGLLLSIAISLLYKWLYSDRHKLPLIDYLIMVCILITIAIYGFMPGVVTGVLITSIVFIIRYARLDAIKFSTTRQNYPSNVVRPLHEQTWLNENGKAILLFKLQNYIFFGSAKFLVDKVNKLIDQDTQLEIKFLIFDFQLVNGIDSSASFSFIRLQQLISHLDIQIIFTHCSEGLLQQFKNHNMIGESSNVMIFEDLDQGMEWCEDQLLKKIPLELKTKEGSMTNALSQLSLNDQQEILFKHYLERIETPGNCYLCKEGEKMDCLYFIESGNISILLENQHSMMRLSKSGPGTIVGEIGFYLNIPRSASVRTDEPCVIYKLSETSMKELEKSHPDIAVSFHKSIIHVLALHVIQTNYELRLLSQ
jgi:SulP family sulfate permease